MGNCKDCKFWRRGDGEVWTTPTDRGVCMRFMEQRSIPEDGIQRPRDWPKNEDYVEKQGWVKTGPLFGCIKFEAR
jgi:hypothetical protein